MLTSLGPVPPSGFLATILRRSARVHCDDRDDDDCTIFLISSPCGEWHTVILSCPKRNLI